VSIEGLVSIFEPSTAENQLSSFDLEFAVPKTFGAPGAILVRSNSPIELLLLSFTLELSDKSCKALHYITNSWVYSTQNSEPRIFFRNKVHGPQLRAHPRIDPRPVLSHARELISQCHLQA
jgi:hypothetical protein